jgi:uroporphyrin-III C-methyltransferase/precorrin-2 dehydrogenase/sirohydrochlorin ferrochelatase
VTVVSPALDPDLAKLKAERRIAHVDKQYQYVDIKAYTLVIAATDDAAINERVASDARQANVPVNVVDEPALCDFIVPSIVRRGDVVLAISTGGLSPALARWLRQEMESYLSGDFERLAQLLAEVRLELRERGVRVRPEAWQGAIDGDLRDLVAAGRHDEAKARLLSALEAAPELKT